jgi:hypothetical protein
MRRFNSLLEADLRKASHLYLKVKPCITCNPNYPKPQRGMTQKKHLKEMVAVNFHTIPFNALEGSTFLPTLQMDHK